MLPEVLARDALFVGDLVELYCDWAPAVLEVYARYDPRRASGSSCRQWRSRIR
jgi:hypothetical protein